MPVGGIRNENAEECAEKPSGGGYALLALTLAVAAVVSTASIAPSATGASADESNSTTPAVTKTTDRTGRSASANSWQVVDCAYPASSECQRSDDKVRVRKSVEATGTENEFRVHLQVDKKDDSTSRILTAQVAYDNNMSQGSIGEANKYNGDTGGGGRTGYYKIKIIDGSNVLAESEVRSLALPNNNKVGAIFMAPTIQRGSLALCVWKRDMGRGTGTSSDPYLIEFDVNWPDYPKVFDTDTTSVGLDKVTDTMGHDIVYEDDAQGDYADNGVQYSDGALSWTPKEKTGAKAGADGWISNVAELSYRIRLDTAAQDFHSGGLPAQHKVSNETKYPTNGQATLAYTVKVTGSNPGSEQKSIDFPVPAVRGLRYDLLAHKTDQNSKPLAGAVFTLYAADGTTPVGTDGKPTADGQGLTATSDDQGRITFTGLPYGTYTVKETAPPAGYAKSDGQWTAVLCYTTTPDALADSTIRQLDAMAERSTAFENQRLTAKATLEAVKRLQGRGGRDGDTFTFTLTPAGGSTQASTVTADMSKTGEGKDVEAKFPEITFETPLTGSSTYSYTISESQDNPIDGLRYSQAEYRADVTVTADGTVSVAYTKLRDDSGKTVEGGGSAASRALFVNAQVSSALPLTGSSDALAGTVLGLSVIAAALVLAILGARRSRM